MKEYESALRINELIKNDSRYLLLKQKEEAMLNDKDTFILLMDYQNKQSEYNESLKYEKYGSNPEGVRKELAELKLKVDTNFFVKEYNKAYKQIQDLLEELTKQILEGVIE